MAGREGAEKLTAGVLGSNPGAGSRARVLTVSLIEAVQGDDPALLLRPDPGLLLLAFAERHAFVSRRRGEIEVTSVAEGGTRVSPVLAPRGAQGAC